tara:strand:+ start:412 stop:633 length:222 start_codon:yes stop_codon:yes gene_type:complete
MVGPWQLVLILVIVFILFGAGKLPKVMGDVGKGVKNLRDGLSGTDGAKSQSQTDNVVADRDQQDEQSTDQKNA